MLIDLSNYVAKSLLLNLVHTYIDIYMSEPGHMVVTRHSLWLVNLHYAVAVVLMWWQ